MQWCAKKDGVEAGCRRVAHVAADPDVTRVVKALQCIVERAEVRNLQERFDLWAGGKTCPRRLPTGSHQRGVVASNSPRELSHCTLSDVELRFFFLFAPPGRDIPSPRGRLSTGEGSRGEPTDLESGDRRGFGGLAGEDTLASSLTQD